MTAFERPAGGVIITGASGQVGQALQRLRQGPEASQTVALDRAALDVTDEAACVERFQAVRRTLGTGPITVINAAAWTAVDEAESARAAAFAANADGAGHVAAAAAAIGAQMLHLSTDYVFSGPAPRPEGWCESDPTRPQSVYGESKLAGEALVFERCPEAVVVRTSWIFAPWGHNFVRSIARAARTRTALRVVADQRGRPTNAEDLACALLQMAARQQAGAPGGVVHYGGDPASTWYDLACAVVEVAREVGPVRAERIEAIGTADWPAPAPRPEDSTLDCRRAQAIYGLSLASWRPRLASVVQALDSNPRDH